MFCRPLPYHLATPPQEGLKDQGGRMKKTVFSFQCSVYSSTEPPFSGNTENQKLKIYSSSFRLRISRIWSGRRDLNSRPSPWQGDALPLSYSRLSKKFDSND